MFLGQLVVGIVLGVVFGILFHLSCGFVGMPMEKRMIALVVGFLVGLILPFLAEGVLT